MGVFIPASHLRLKSPRNVLTKVVFGKLFGFSGYLSLDPLIPS